jgi:hypothetical protein
MTLWPIVSNRFPEVGGNQGWRVASVSGLPCLKFLRESLPPHGAECEEKWKGLGCRSAEWLKLF